MSYFDQKSGQIEPRRVEKEPEPTDARVINGSYFLAPIRNFLVFSRLFG